jgi:murein L,D-transpeptidase YcbB/YkuD
MLKKRLQLAGMLEAGDTSNVYTPALKSAIRKTQASYGYEHDTLLTLTLLKELNVPIENRIKQLWVNIERMRWMPDVPQKEFIYVNIPEFRMHVMNGATKVFDMNVITGKEGHGTVMFSGELNQVVFSPYWNLPENIVKKEVLPAMEKNPQYIEENHMEITGERNGLPVIRQLPGEWNELGNIKFLFPNSLNIYFHDTPHKWLFNKDQRAYSHGCIRLADAPKLAAHLLRDEPSWTAERLDSAMHADKEKYVKLREPVPVLIYYYTAWVDENGQLQFRKDIYGHDAAMAERLF